MPLPTDVNQLIHSIYQGVLEDEPWDHFLKGLIELFHSDTAVLLVVPNEEYNGKYLLSRVVDKQAKSPKNRNHWIALDPFQDIPSDTPIRLDDLDHQQAIEESSFFKDLIQPSGIRYILAVNIPAEKHANLVLKIRLARQGEKQDFSEDDITLLESLVSHLKLALHFLDLMTIQKIERNAFADAINQFMLGTLILDRSGKIVASNRVAREKIEHYNELTTRNGTLVITDKNTHQQLYTALADIERGHCNNPPMPRTLTVKLSESSALGLMVRPVRPEDALNHPAHAHAVVFISDSQETQEISSETLADLFGFTGSESKMAAYLANGHTLTEAASALSISINTAKSHARNIYEKTGVNKQTKFIQLVSNSVARVS